MARKIANDVRDVVLFLDGNRCGDLDDIVIPAKKIQKVGSPIEWSAIASAHRGCTFAVIRGQTFVRLPHNPKKTKDLKGSEWRQVTVNNAEEIAALDAAVTYQKEHFE